MHAERLVHTLRLHLIVVPEWAVSTVTGWAVTAQQIIVESMSIAIFGFNNMYMCR